MELLIGVFIFAFGLMIGSFLNVCIYRIPKKESFVTGRSHCMACGAPIKWYDLIPVLSYLLLRGRCRNCGSKISLRYPAVELTNAIIYLLTYSAYGLSLTSLFFAVSASALVIAAFIDYDTMEIPNGIVIFIFIIGCFAMIFSRNIPFYERIIGLFAVSVPLFIAALVSKGGMGGGDIKLAAAAGLLLGYKNALLSLLLASVLGSVFGLLMIKFKNKSLKTAIPFGPFLSAAFIFSSLYGTGLINAYLSLFR